MKNLEDLEDIPKRSQDPRVGILKELPSLLKIVKKGHECKHKLKERNNELNGRKK